MADVKQQNQMLRIIRRHFMEESYTLCELCKVDGSEFTDIDIALITQIWKTQIPLWDDDRRLSNLLDKCKQFTINTRPAMMTMEVF